MSLEVAEALEAPTTRMAGIFKCILMFGLDMAGKAISTREFNAAMIAYQ